ncbi:MAG TPA: ABC transporter permease [Baekduia sp.]|nr:ABC transporter permease [Baekduia sp.]
MRKVLTRLLGALGVLWAAATFTFFVQSLLPGDRATLILNQQTGQTIERSQKELAPINEQFGFDHPLIRQYLDYLGGLLHGDLGSSYQQKEGVAKLISEQIGPTLLLTATALVLAWIIALVATTLTAKRGRVSRLASGFETFAAGLPHYWLGVILLVVFAINLGWFPVEGGHGFSGLVLPALTLALPLAGFLGQVTRDEFENVLDQPFVTSARARGMSDLGVRLRHALRHAVLPAITLSGWALGALFSSAVVVELVFARPGIGGMLVTAASSRDIPLVSGIVMVVALVYVVANLLVDFAYTIVDPRLKSR